MAALRIIAITVLAAACYGVVHDQITARICLEYFTVAHPPVFDTTSPTLLALGWGVLATWWVALPLGASLAIAARVGNQPKLTATDLLTPIAVLLGFMTACALAAGVIGAILGTMGLIKVAPYFATRIHAAHHTAFLADLWAHGASYLAGIIGGLTLVVLTYRRRGQGAAGV